MRKNYLEIGWDQFCSSKSVESRFPPLSFCLRRRYPMQRWNEKPSTTTGNASSNKGPWDDVEHAWGRGGYIERAVDRDCGSYLPTETLSYANDLNIDHLGKETLTTAMRRSPKRWEGAAAFCVSAVLNVTRLPCQSR